MHARYRFLKTRNGITSFAAVSVRAQASSAWATLWAPAAGPLQQIYGDAVELGIQRAVEAYERRDGTPHQIEIMSIEQTIVDTRPDAVACATAIAVWQALGGAERDARIDVDDAGGWRVTFSSPS